jgi:hypothetical protein
MQEWISMYIDDELTMDEKIQFLEKVHADRSFKDETVELIEFEKMLRQEVVCREPSITVLPQRRHWFAGWRRLWTVVPALAAAAAMLLLLLPVRGLKTDAAASPYRFVIYQPQANQAEIVGTFTQWKRTPMNRIGTTGYWEIVLKLPEGEHRFSYLIEGTEHLPDPTILSREKDDFGSENSILYVGKKT